MHKAIVLTAGHGTRMRQTQANATLDARQAEVAKSGLKAMMPVGRPFIDYVLFALVEAGYRDVCLVLGPDHDMLRDHVLAYRTSRLQIDFAIQPEPRGTADALAAAADFAATDSFLLINGDNYYPRAALAGLRELDGNAVAAFPADALCQGNISQDRLSKYAILVADSRGNLKQVTEKPTASEFAQPDSGTLISMNCWRFTPRIFDACRAIPLSKRGEYEVTGAVAYAINQLGISFKMLMVNEPVLDLSTRADVAEVSARLSAVPIDL